jgi:hypothetical protein
MLRECPERMRCSLRRIRGGGRGLGVVQAQTALIRDPDYAEFTQWVEASYPGDDRHLTELQLKAAIDRIPSRQRDVNPASFPTTEAGRHRPQPRRAGVACLPTSR